MTCDDAGMDASDIQVGDEVVHGEFALWGTVVAIQRRPYRAKVQYPDGRRRWYPVRELRRFTRFERAGSA